MNLLNVSFGIFAFMPLGWLFMAFIIAIECFLMSKILAKQWRNKRVCNSVIFSNIISGIIGIIISLVITGGWWLVVWFPWVGRKEADPNLWFVIYYIVAFVLSVIIETITNILFLKKEYKKSEIIRATLIVNIVTYLLGSVILYSYSFN